MEMMKKLIQEVVDKLDLEVPESDRKKFAEMMVQIFDKGSPPQEVVGFSNDMIEYIYNYGYRLYNMGNYKNARDVFLGLIRFKPNEARFFLALAASHHRLNEYDKAVDYYLVYGGLEPNNPIPYYYMYDCYYQTGLVDDALICLLEVIRRCNDNPIYAKMKERSQLMLDNLKKEIEELEARGELVADLDDAPKENNEIKISEKSLKEIEAKVKKTLSSELQNEEKRIEVEKS